MGSTTKERSSGLGEKKKSWLQFIFLNQVLSLYKGCVSDSVPKLVCPRVSFSATSNHPLPPLVILTFFELLDNCRRYLDFLKFQNQKTCRTFLLSLAIFQIPSTKKRVFLVRHQQKTCIFGETSKKSVTRFLVLKKKCSTTQNTDFLVDFQQTYIQRKKWKITSGGGGDWVP